MVSVISVRNYTEKGGAVVAEARISMADGETINASDLNLAYISHVRSVVPLAANHVFGGAVINNPDSYDNSVTMTLYSVSGGSLVSAGSAEWLVVAVQY